MWQNTCKWAWTTTKYTQIRWRFHPMNHPTRTCASHGVIFRATPGSISQLCCTSRPPQKPTILVAEIVNQGQIYEHDYFYYYEEYKEVRYAGGHSPCIYIQLNIQKNLLRNPHFHSTSEHMVFPPGIGNFPWSNPIITFRCSTQLLKSKKIIVTRPPKLFRRTKRGPNPVWLNKISPLWRSHHLFFLRATTDILLHRNAAPVALLLDALNTMFLKLFSFSSYPAFSITSKRSSVESTHLSSSAVKPPSILLDRSYHIQMNGTGQAKILIGNEYSRLHSHVVPETGHMRRLAILMFLRVTEPIRCKGGRDRLDPIAGSQKNSASINVRDICLWRYFFEHHTRHHVPSSVRLADHAASQTLLSLDQMQLTWHGQLKSLVHPIADNRQALKKVSGDFFTLVSSRITAYDVIERGRFVIRTYLEVEPDSSQPRLGHCFWLSQRWVVYEQRHIWRWGRAVPPWRNPRCEMWRWKEAKLSEDTAPDWCLGHQNR